LVLTFLDNGRLAIYHKTKDRELDGWWKVDDKGKVSLYLGKKIRTGHISDKNMFYLTIGRKPHEFTN